MYLMHVNNLLFFQYKILARLNSYYLFKLSWFKDESIGIKTCWKNGRIDYNRPDYLFTDDKQVETIFQINFEKCNKAPVILSQLGADKSR